MIPRTVGCLLVGIACNSPPTTHSADDFPQNVGPPFGLDVLRGGMSRNETSVTLAKDGSNSQRLNDVLRADHRGIESVLKFDQDRLGDIVFEVSDCAATNQVLRSKWGEPATSPMKEMVWESKSSPWVAGIVVPQRGSSCTLIFTSSTFFGAKPRALGALAQIQPGLSRENASKIDATLANAPAALPAPGIVGAVQAVTFQGDQVANTYMMLPARALVALRHAWGSGTALDDGEPRTIWFDGDSGDRATLKDVRVVFDRAARWEDWLGDGPSIKALGSVLGKTIDDLRKERGEALYEDSDAHDSLKRTLYSVRLPAEEWDPGSSARATLHLDNGVITSVATTLLYTTSAIRDQMLQRFEAKWGPKKATKLGIDFKVANATIHVIDLSTEFQINMTSAVHSLP
jgi:hypothetical protein